MDKKRKVKKFAIVSRSVSGVTGATTIILEHTRRLRAAGWEVHVFGEKVAAGRVAAAGGETHILPRWPIGSIFKRRLFAWLFEREIRGERFDLIQGHGDTLKQDILCLHNCVHAAHEAVSGKPLPRRSGVGAIHSRILHDQKFKLLVANSKLMKDEIMGRFGIPEEKIAVVHPGHDPERFKLADRAIGSPIRKELGVGAGEILVGLITSGDFKKRGVGVFLAALSGLRGEVKKKTRAVIIGQETRLAPYRELAVQTGMGDRIRFLPPVPDVEKYFHALDVYVHPALYEEFGLSVQEAMACGIPVLTSRRVGASELFLQDAAELVLREPSVPDLTASLETLLSDSSRRRRLAEAGLIACAGNTWDASFKKHLELYEGLLSSSKS